LQPAESNPYVLRKKQKQYQMNIKRPSKSLFRTTEIAFDAGTKNLMKKIGPRFLL